ncbi:LOW QUALITY PROTEIN: uncharacterized protein LOC106132550, partial [Amyelois transitella]|uniref:LOW QUALITY PROTEIN: uncharacterized protein LOC106132550 n=1 Tax=Amyelois transitella TaxID=680683 RepID=UPI00299061BA
MPVDCQRKTCGGKGNMGMFYERSPNICAAGLPTQQPDERVQDSLQHYLLKDETDALISDAIIPSKKPRPLPPLRRPMPVDKRFAGMFGEVPELVNPPSKSKFQTLVDDFKSTAYSSYWKKPLGTLPDAVPMLPEGFDINTTFGMKTPFHGRLYDIVMPKEPYPDKTPESKKPGVQLDYKYCEPPFKPHVTYGHRCNVDNRGILVKCCLTDDRVKIGTASRVIINTIQSNFQNTNQPRIGKQLAPYDNISCVPKGYSFGKLKPPDNLPECLTTCDINPDRQIFLKCLKHLNTLRKCLSTRFLPTFYRGFYLNLKYFDHDKSGWLPRQIVYDYCGTKLIRFDPSLIEPLLSMWQAFDGTKIKYKTFVHILNFKEPLPEMPKVTDVPQDCLDFRTTYSEMVKPDKEPDNSPMAGIPSGRYFDLDYPVTPIKYSKADQACLPHESDMKSCLCPSVMTLLTVNHRHMYAKRDPEIVRRVFEASGETFTDESFNAIWKEAEKLHSQGWVCYETFRRALEGKKKDSKKTIKSV